MSNEKSNEKVDMVNHPPHYARFKFEPINVLQEWFGRNPLLWQVTKYLARAEHKNDYLEDLKKARFYLNVEIENEEKKRQKFYEEHKICNRCETEIEDIDDADFGVYGIFLVHKNVMLCWTKSLQLKADKKLYEEESKRVDKFCTFCQHGLEGGMFGEDFQGQNLHVDCRKVLESARMPIYCQRCNKPLWIWDSITVVTGGLVHTEEEKCIQQK